MATLANIKVEPMTVTWNSVDLGYTDGDIEVSTEDQVVDITAHQTGTHVLDQIHTGASVEVSLTIKETSVAQLKAIFEVHSDSATPAAGTEVDGWGMDKDFTGRLAESAKLYLNPITAADNSRDIAFHKAYPVLNSITYSGENPEMVSVTFKCFPDLTLAAEHRYFSQGDHTQDLT